MQQYLRHLRAWSTRQLPAVGMPDPTPMRDRPRELPANLVFDRITGSITAGRLETLLIHGFALGARISAHWSFRGFGAACRLLRHLLPSRQIAVRLNADATFCFPFADGYWSALLDRAFRYEHDVEALLRTSANTEYTLIDCGANFGYWSVLASSQPFGAQHVIAIEPSLTSFVQLVRNASLSRTGFRCLQKAVGAQAGVARLTGRKHEAMTIAGADADDNAELVAVIALDSLIDEGHVSPDQRTIIKLDVEAMEIEALKGSARLLEGDCVVICEDHGSDRHHTVSRYLLKNTRLKLFCFDPATRRFKRLRDVAPLDRIKHFRNRGYNVLATASPFWEQRILAAAVGQSRRSPSRLIPSASRP